MKKFNLVFLICAVIAISACKKDSSGPSGGTLNSSLANTHCFYKLKLDGVPYAAEDGLNGYMDFPFYVDHDSANYTDWINFSIFSNGDSLSPVFEIVRSKWKPGGDMITIAELRNLFSPGIHSYALDPNDGIVIAFQRNNSIQELYTSNSNINQTGSTFVITDTMSESGVLGPNFKFRATFSCKIYDQTGVNARTITDGETVCRFQGAP